MLWIPITVAAAFFQNLRSALQRQLKSELSDLGAASVRFLYALPFALTWLALVTFLSEASLPAVNSDFAGWVISGAIADHLHLFADVAFFILKLYGRNSALQNRSHPGNPAGGRIAS